MSVDDLKKIKKPRRAYGIIDLGGVEFEIKGEAQWKEFTQTLDRLYQKHGGAVGAFFWAWAEAYWSEADETVLLDMEAAEFFPGATLEDVKREFEEGEKRFGTFNGLKWDDVRDWMRATTWGVLCLEPF